MTVLRATTFTLASTLVFLGLAFAGCAAESGPSGPSDEPIDEPSDPDDEPPVPASCELSALGSAVHAAAMASAPGEHSVAPETILSYRNSADDALLRGNGVNVDWLYEQAIAAVGQQAACQALDARWFASNGVAYNGNVAGASHLKYASVDNQVTFVGSTNMDTQSWNQSGEASIAVDDAAVNARWDGKIFDPHFATAVPTGHCL